MKALTLLLPFALASCTTPGTVQTTPVPEQAAMLSVAKCSNPAPVASADYSQQLKPKGDMKLFAKPELDGALGGAKGDIFYARKVSDGVWAILVTDYDKQVCEAYVSEAEMEMIGNDPGPPVEDGPDAGTPETAPDAGPDGT